MPSRLKKDALVEKALQKNLIFKDLDKTTVDALIQAFEKAEALKGQVIVQQGESAEHGYVYVIAEGECSVAVNGNIIPAPYGTLKAKSMFGEMGVMNNVPKAATTITALSDKVLLFRARRSDFRQVLRAANGDDEKSSGYDSTADTLTCDERALEEIDDAINQFCGNKTKFGGEVIRQYRSNRIHIWTRWSGTVVQHKLRTSLFTMALSLVFVILVRLFANPTWSIGSVPDPENTLIQHLSMIQQLWLYQMTLTTFIVTFYVNQAYSYWYDVYLMSRGIQGRLNDFLLVLATGVQRNPDGTLTANAEALLEDASSFTRLFHALFWASCARRFKVLLTRQGLERMVHRGMMTMKQMEVIASLDIPIIEQHTAPLEWMMIRSWQGIDDGTLRGGDPLTRTLLENLTRLRATYAGLLDALVARMPLTYTHLVQILVDSFILISPLALYASLGIYSIFCVGLLTLFYTGLTDLAKMLLDPLDNENFTQFKTKLGMDLGVLTRESNVASGVWKNTGEKLPFDLRPPV